MDSDDIYKALVDLGIVDPYGTIFQDKLDEKKSALYDFFSWLMRSWIHLKS